MRIVLTFTGRDKPGIIHRLADIVREHGGNWQDSRMANLAGRFAGILAFDIPDINEPGLRTAFDGLAADGIRVLIDTGEVTLAPPQQRFRLECTATDRPGIVRAITQVLLSHGINVQELSTTTIEAPMTGGYLFRATAHIGLPEGMDFSALRDDMHAIADDLLVELHAEPR